MATISGPFSRRIGNSDWRWISFCGKPLRSERSTSVSCEVDELDADFVADRFESQFLGDEAELDGRFDQLGAVAVAIGNAAALFELAAIEQAAPQEDFAGFHSVGLFYAICASRVSGGEGGAGGMPKRQVGPQSNISVRSSTLMGRTWFGTAPSSRSAALPRTSTKNHLLPPMPPNRQTKTRSQISADC